MQIHIYIYTCIYMQNKSQWHNDKGRAKASLSNMYLSLYCKGSKRVIQDFTVRGSWRPNRTAIYGRQRCVFLALQGCSTGGPGAQLSVECWLSLPHLVTNGSPKLKGPPKAPSAGSSFPYHILSATSLDSNSIGGPEGPFGLVWLSLPHLVSYSNCSLSWQSYIIVQRPLTRPLNLWNGMFDRHQADITVTLFRGHSLPVHHFGLASLPGSKVKIQHL